MTAHLLYHAHFSTRWKLLTTVLLCVLGDFLLFDSSAGQLALGIFALVLLFAMTWHNLPRLDTSLAIGASALVMGQAFALILGNSVLPFYLLLSGMVLLCAMACGIYRAQALQWLWLAVQLAAYALILPVKSFMRWEYIRCRRKTGINYALLLRNWCLPAVISVLFISLFIEANPVFDLIARWLDIGFIADLFENPARPFFWGFLFIACWMVVRPRVHASMYPRTRHALLMRSNAVEWLFSPAAILRGLIIFNVIFAVQSFSDMAYLWGGLTLPQGISHAQYAQRGAYSLLCAVLLAAGFVLLALREGSDCAKHPLICALVYIWVGQNILLVTAAMQRLSLYVEAYSLTYLRIAAFIWMGLVAIGLALIILRIIYNKSGSWLVRANLASLVTVLYICSFANIGGFIAEYNVTHSEGMGRGEQALDVYYLLHEVGLPALPALQHYEKHANLTAKRRTRVQGYIKYLEERLDLRQAHWRSWTFRNYWLALQNANSYGDINQQRVQP